MTAVTQGPFGTNTICPRCGGGIPCSALRGQYPGALSRVDNETEICSSCGRDEAIYNMHCPGEPLPPVNQPVWTTP